MIFTRKAFSIVELLVVVAIVTVLGAIFLPVYVRSRATARRAVSQSNLKQISVVVFQYAGSHNEQFPHGRTAEQWKIEPFPSLETAPSSSQSIEAEYLFTSPSTTEAYNLNPILGNTSQLTLNSPSTTPTFYEAKEDSMGGHNIAFADGHVKWVPSTG